MRTWTRTEECLPPEGQIVTVLNDHIEQQLVFERGLWWFPDRSMYVYFTPSLWTAQRDGFDAGENDPCIICGHPRPEHYSWSTECKREDQ